MYDFGKQMSLLVDRTSKQRPVLGNLLWVAFLATALAACAQGGEGSTVHTEKPLGTSGTAILTSADVRLVATTKLGPGSLPGRIRPEQVTCIEPSPDIAKAVHESFNFGGSLGLGGLPSGVSVDLALAFAKARAESVAQMTERLATIQLLRDGLYRACEAYANGAISDTTYAVLLGRYDDTMVTLLMGELAAGNYGRQLASLGGATGGSSSALVQKAVADQQAADNAEQSVAEADATVEQRNREVGAAQARLDATEPGTSQRTAAEKDLEVANANLSQARAEQAALKEGAQQLLRSAASSSASAFAQSAGGVEGSNLTAKDRTGVAGHLAEMQRKYLENINSDALMVACISSLDRPAGNGPSNLDQQFTALGNANEAYLQERAAAAAADGTLPAQNVAEHRQKILLAARNLAASSSSADLSPLAKYCLSGLLPVVMDGYLDILTILKSRSRLGRDLESFEDAVEAIKALNEQMDSLSMTVGELKPPAQ